ncbi:helix-turn-helix domain-containing protein [Roseicella sp. DB1501]|uniref:helix-turn-helix transcriptional regulator n=1 Tax=Roseicella sp. DB1501 TaxID=2730925 RepID=UPI0014931EC6|nr:helix-turn-helix domain-containing protein [Roseicella sp. DB1501]
MSKVAQAPRSDARSYLLTPRQCAAARAWLGWSQASLGRAAGVARKTVSDFEKGRREPNWRTAKEIMLAFERHGLEVGPGLLRHVER